MTGQNDMHETSGPACLHADLPRTHRQVSQPDKGRKLGFQASMGISLEQITSTLSLANTIGDPGLSLKYQALERYGLEEFAEVAAKIVGGETDNDRHSLAYLTYKNLSLELHGLENIPPTGSVLVVCNHRLGLLDGILVDHLLSKVRPDRKHLAVAGYGDFVGDRIIPIDPSIFIEGPRSSQTLETLRTARQQAVQHLQQGNCLCVFPGGGATVYDPVAGAQSDAPYTGFAYLLELIRSVDYALVPVFTDCQFRPLLFEAFETTDWEFFALQWAEINAISNRTIPIHIGRATRERPSNSIAHAESIHALIHNLPNDQKNREARNGELVSP